ncbi:hypothetical protein [Aeoliella sp.]|uniref:hypothetical protein n=1 Tax=Aeoliella sp. TaxID=2795800 RepID=UPI003CCC1319
MFHRSLLALLFGLLCASTVLADDVPSSAQSSPWSPYPMVPESEFVSGSSSVWIYDEQFQPVAMQESCCDTLVGCGDSFADGCGDNIGSGRKSPLDRCIPRSHLPLPLCKDIAGDRAEKLLPPLGTSYVFTSLDRNVAVSDVRLSFGANLPVSVDRVEVPTTTFHAVSHVSRIDLWVFPCVNVYGIVGHTQTKGDVAVEVDAFPLPTSGPVLIRAPVNLYGPTAGFGVTSVVGGDCWFASLDVNKTWTTFNRLDSSLTALVITPRVGMIIESRFFNGEVHVGAMYQDTAQTVELTIDHAILGNDLNVRVDQFEPNPWNFLVGTMWALDERVQVILEGGMGGRSYVITGLTLRY